MDTLWHITWGDGDDTFVIAPNRETAIARMPEGRDMVNCTVCLDRIYKEIYAAGVEAERERILGQIQLMYMNSTGQRNIALRECLDDLEAQGVESQ